MAGYIGSGASVVSSGAENKKVFDITTNTTSLTGLNYTVGKVHVYHNGVRLVDGTDYTATNSTSITLTVAAVSGDQVVVVSYASFQVADALLTSGGTMTGNLTVQGTVAATAYTGDGSALTGVGSPSIDDNGNATAITITNDEKIGIGTTNPIGLLSIVDSSTGSGMELVPEIASNTNRLTNYNRTTSAYKNFRLDALQLEFQTSGNERMKIDNLGYVTKPNQPYFYVRAPGTQYVTAGGYVGFTWSSEVKDVGGNFASNVFTAPVTGVYSLTLNARYDSVKDNASYYNTTIATSNRSHAQLFSPQGFDRTVDYWVFTMNVIADMDAGDTASCNVGQIGGSSGTAINGSTAFYGYLLG